MNLDSLAAGQHKTLNLIVSWHQAGKTVQRKADHCPDWETVSPSEELKLKDCTFRVEPERLDSFSLVLDSISERGTYSSPTYHSLGEACHHIRFSVNNYLGAVRISMEDEKVVETEFIPVETLLKMDGE